MLDGARMTIRPTLSDASIPIRPMKPPVVKPQGDARPAWKVLRVLGSLLGLPGFELDSIDDVRGSLPKSDAEVAHEMARVILISIEDKSLKTLKRNDYLNTVVQCVAALKGVRPD